LAFSRRKINQINASKKLCGGGTFTNHSVMQSFMAEGSDTL
jgi:hypothetical protein